VTILGDVLKHLEHFLGTFTEAWGDPAGFKVLRFPNRPREGVTVFSTLGLSDYVLTLTTDRKVRQEFVFVSADSDGQSVARFLGGVAADVLKDRIALVRGQVLGPRSAILGSQLTALYCAIPVFLSDDFGQCDSSEPATVFVWLIPIWSSEANAIQAHGWRHFESVMAEANADLFSLDRPPLA
jgi:Suppressor of fused protein (SUFU)